MGTWLAVAMVPIPTIIFLLSCIFFDEYGINLEWLSGL